MDKLAIFHITFNIASYKNFIEEIINYSKKYESRYVCVANVHTLIEAYRNDNFALKVRNADIVTPDGMPIVWALRLLHGIKQERVAGMDLLPDLLLQAELKRIPVYFYGGTERMLNQTKTFIATNYPLLALTGFYSPPFRPLTVQEEEEIILKINSSGARIVFVVLGCPKQERWMANMKGRVYGTMIGIGGALPVLVGMQKRAPYWMQKSGLEWFFRLLQDPKRLWKRYFVTNSIFLYLLAADKIKVFLRNRNIFFKRRGG